MPLPMPRNDETQDDFISRCIPLALDDQGLDPDSEDDRSQATAICFSKWDEVHGNSRAMAFVCNMVTEVGTRMWEGREFLVSPVVALAEGVLNGEYVPQDEVMSYPEAWNGRPVVIYHPTDNDRPISANNPDVLSQFQIGQMFNALSEIGEDGRARLKGELWVDTERVKNLGGEAFTVLERLRNGDPLEVSTAYFRRVMHQTGVYGDDAYETVAESLKPDHLAVLPNGEGACSWMDGCGAPRFNQSDDASDHDVRDVTDSESEPSGNQQENQGGSEMEELIAQIVEDGRLAVNADDLAELSEDELHGMITVLEAMPAEEQGDEPDVVDNDADSDTPDEDTPDDEAPEVDPRVNTLLAAIDELGGVEAVVDVVQNHRQEREQRVEQLVTGLMANEACTFDEDQLRRMDLEQLLSLQKMLTPVDYSGMGVNVARDGEEELAMPTINWASD